MRKIAIAAAVSLSLSGVTGVSHALGLGEIEMYSALNQSLDAEIAILSATDAELQNMQVRLAPSDAFARAGLEQLPVLSTVVFAVDRRPDGKAVVKVTSDGPVLEPFLNFLIEVEAPGSVKLVREYTVLLNPTSPLTRGSSQPATTFTDDQIFVGDNSASVQSASVEGAGVEIDLSNTAIVGAAATAVTVANTFDGNDTGGEVIFTETSAGTFTVPVADTSASAADTLEVATVIDDNLFVPDEQIFANTEAGSSVVGTDGQLISLEQELGNTPQIDVADVSNDLVGGESIELASGGESLSLDNLGAQGEPADNAIFGNEFETAGAELIVGDELRELVGDVATSSQPTVEFTETAQAQTFETSVADSQPAADQDLAVSDVSSIFTDTDAGTGDLIDLSGIIDDSAAVTQPVVEDVVSSSTTSTDGIVVEIDDSARSAAASQNIELSGNTYRIQSSDTLWSIANAQKARGVTPHQMMVALLDSNPNAFVGGNMNRLVNGAVLQIPTAASQNSFEPASALAIVQSWTRDNKPPAGIATRTVTNIVQPVVVTDDNDTEIVINDQVSTTLTRDLEDVNTRYEQARDELAAETKQRDELQGRVNNLTDNMEQMKTLITVRENELIELQNEVTSAENNAAEIDAQISKLSDASEGVAEMQDDLNKDLAEAQNAIERQADLEKNLASAEAEAQSVRLSSEEDSLRAQLAALEIEKRDFEATSQLEKAELVRQSEAEKTRLLEQAKAEREKIMAELDAEKARISSEAEMEIARIKGEAATENQRVATQAEAETERLAAETAQMQSQLEKMEAEKNRLMAEAETKSAEMQAQAEEQAKLTAQAEAEAARATDESARVKDRLAAMKKEADDKAAAAQAALANANTDADGTMENTVDKVTDAGKNMAAGGAAAVGGLLGFAPLQEMIGNRKNVLAAGAGLSLLGLLAAWGLRRRKYAEPKEVQGLRPRGDASRVASPQTRAKYEQEEAMYGDDQTTQPQQRTDNRGTAAAAAAAAAVAGTAAAVSSRDSAPAAEQQPAQPAQAAPVATTAAARMPANPTDAELEEVALDDTITEAEVYLRYGLHGQAEDLLKTAIDRSPDNEEYHFKLLENYHDQKNNDGFKKAAATFNEKFPASGHAARVSEMGTELSSAGAASGSGASGVAAAGAGAAALAAGSLASFKGSAADHSTQLADDSAASDADLLDQTIDPGNEFSVDELQATGNLNEMVDDVADLDDQGGMSLDDVDLASFDDDGTMNLEEVAGSQMSGGDLGSLDLTNPVDGALDNLTLDDADLNAGMGDNIRSGLAAADLPGQSPVAGGTDEMETMLDLAKAYIDMGDNDNASKALKDIAARGNPLQQTEANELLKKLT